MKRIVCFFLALSLAACLTGCWAEIPEQTSLPPVTGDPQAGTTVTTTKTEPTRYPLFSVKAGPTPISGEELLEIQQELTDILAQKNYTDRAKTLVWDTVALLSENYTKFQYLFSFLDPPDTASYLRQNILFPLETMVDTLTCSEEQFGGGWAADATKEICIYMTFSQEDDCNTLIHELNHMLTTKEHGLVSSNLYRYIDEGDATFHQLSGLGQRKYRVMGDIKDITRDHPEPDSQILFLRAGGFGGGNYSDFSLIFFKLLALTDFETMTLFDQPKGEFLIREDLGRRYGEDGLAFYDSLTTQLDYGTLLDAENRFLKLFLSRLSEVDSPEEMLSYLLLYRVYRRSFAPEYLEIDGDLIREISHPALDYVATDQAVADAVLEWGLLNTQALSREEAALAARVLAGRTAADDTDAYWQRWELEFYQPLDPFLLCDAWYTVGEDVAIACNTELPEGEEVYVFENWISMGLHGMVEKGQLIVP